MEQVNQFTPVRIQRSRQKKQTSPNMLEIKYVGRPGPFGNPFKVGDLVKIGNGKRAGEFSYLICLLPKHNDGSFKKLNTTEEVLAAYTEYLTKYPLSEQRISELKGKNLSCWCGLDKKCHADILLKIVNPEFGSKIVDLQSTF